MAALLGQEAGASIAMVGSYAARSLPPVPRPLYNAHVEEEDPDVGPASQGGPRQEYCTRPGDTLSSSVLASHTDWAAVCERFWRLGVAEIDSVLSKDAAAELSYQRLGRTVYTKLREEYVEAPPAGADAAGVKARGGAG